MNVNAVYRLFDPLWSDLNEQDSFPNKRPLLAHYTSIAALEQIMSNDELWFSNPLYMNDLEEMRFGIIEGVNAFRSHQGIREVCEKSGSYEALAVAFENQFQRFSNEHALDTYVFCLAKHEAQNTDGLLSMWRGYGGNGSGAALIFNTAQIEQNETVPLIFSNVVYATGKERLNWIKEKLDQFALLLAKHPIQKEKLYLPAHQLFERLKIFALFTKHPGFSEEQEWRVVYLRDRDVDHTLDSMLHYAIAPQGIQPKLKFKMGQYAPATNLSLENLVTQIILGPTVSSPLAVAAVRRMLEKVGKNELASRVLASTTPFRA